MDIIKGKPHADAVHTVSLYLSPLNQRNYYDYIISLKPERIIFNPGTENKELQDMAIKNCIEIVESCTLMMLSGNTY